MKKRNILINLQDYNNELETVLEKKDFSEDVKNLLLSMIYKVETSYSDYKKAKVNVPEKGEFVKEIINNIKNNCNKIELIKPKTKEEISSINTIIDKENKYIKVYQNEKECLEAIYKLSLKPINIDNKEHIAKKPLQDFFEVSFIANKMEVIRDFDGWTWNCLSYEIPNIYYNILFQNLLILLGNNVIDEIVNNSELINNNIGKLEDILEKKYGKEISKEIIYKLKIIICQIYYSNNKLEFKKIKKEKESLKESIQKNVNKEEYLELLSTEKKRLLRLLDTKEKIIKDKKLLEKEFVKRNKNGEELFSINSLIKLLNNEKKEILNKIHKCNDLMNPKKFTKNTQKIEQKIKFIEDVLKNNIEENVIEFQKNFINCIFARIKMCTNKKELLELMYIFRYYFLLNINNEKQVNEVQEIQSLLNSSIDMLIKKAIELKLIKTIFNNIKFTENIIKSIFYLKVIDIENLECEIEKNQDKFEIKIYDEESLEFKKEVELIEIIDLKLNKKVRIFN